MESSPPHKQNRAKNRMKCSTWNILRRKIEGADDSEGDKEKAPAG